MQPLVAKNSKSTWSTFRLSFAKIQGRKQVRNMTLSEKIITLRNKYQMSQGDLAEKLNVSRQSVSKWETGVSTPDLDKLIAMSNLFQVTMDELVKEDVMLFYREESPVIKAEDTTKRKAEKQEEYFKNHLGVKLVGLILVILTPVLVICATFGFVPFGRVILPISLYLLTCGFICLFSKKNVGRRILMMTLVIVAVIIAVIVLNVGAGVSIS